MDRDFTQSDRPPGERAKPGGGSSLPAGADLQPSAALQAVAGLDDPLPSDPASVEKTLVERGLLKIGDLARLAQKTVRTLHFYEELDILRPVERTRGGFRLYAPESVERVWLIDKLQVLGLSLPEIRDLLLEWEESETGARAAHAIMASLLERRRKLREELERLHALELELNATLDYLHHCTTGCGKQTSPVKCPTCDHAAREEKRPRMISGLYPH